MAAKGPTASGRSTKGVPAPAGDGRGLFGLADGHVRRVRLLVLKRRARRGIGGRDGAAGRRAGAAREQRREGGGGVADLDGAAAGQDRGASEGDGEGGARGGRDVEPEERVRAGNKALIDEGEGLALSKNGAVENGRMTSVIGPEMERHIELPVGESWSRILNSTPP